MPVPKTTGELVTAADWNGIGTFQISSIDLSSTATFTSIPDVYRDLRLEIVVRPTSPTTARSMLRVQFNGSTTAYRWQHLRTVSTTVSGAVSALPDTSAAIGPTTGLGSTSNSYANYEATIPSYTAGILKVGRCYGGLIHHISSTTDWQTTVCNFSWGSTSAIESMVFLLDNGSFAAGSRATLYGVGAV